MVERVLPHKHCPECGTAIVVKEKYCSKACEETHDERVRAKRRQLLWLYVGSIGLFALAMLMIFGRL